MGTHKILDTGNMNIAESNKVFNLLEARNHKPISCNSTQVPPPCQVEEQVKVKKRRKNKQLIIANKTSKSRWMQKLPAKYAKRRWRRRKNAIDEAVDEQQLKLEELMRTIKEMTGEHEDRVQVIADDQLASQQNEYVQYVINDTSDMDDEDDNEGIEKLQKEMQNINEMDDEFVRRGIANKKPFHQPSWTLVPHQTAEGLMIHLSQQTNIHQKSSQCQMDAWKKRH